MIFHNLLNSSLVKLLGSESLNAAWHGGGTALCASVTTGCRKLKKHLGAVSMDRLRHFLIKRNDFLIITLVGPRVEGALGQLPEVPGWGRERHFDQAGA